MTLRSEEDSDAGVLLGRLRSRRAVPIVQLDRLNEALAAAMVFSCAGGPIPTSSSVLFPWRRVFRSWSRRCSGRGAGRPRSPRASRHGSPNCRSRIAGCWRPRPHSAGTSTAALLPPGDEHDSALARPVDVLMQIRRVEEAMAIGDELAARSQAGRAASVHLRLVAAGVTAACWDLGDDHLAAARPLVNSPGSAQLEAELALREGEFALGVGEVASAEGAACRGAARDLGTREESGQPPRGWHLPSGWLGELEGKAILIAARVSQPAEFVEVTHRSGGVEAALARRLAGSAIPFCMAVDRAIGIVANPAWTRTSGRPRPVTLTVVNGRVTSSA